MGNKSSWKRFFFGGKEPMSGRGAAALRATGARANSPQAPTGEESSRDWALRIIHKSSGELPGNVDPNGILKISLSSVTIEIRDRTTGATGVFDYGGLEVGRTLDVPVTVQPDAPWINFRTEDPVHLSDFQDTVRFPSLALGWKLIDSIQFGRIPIDHPSRAGKLWYGDGVPIGEPGEPGIGISEAAGFMQLRRTEWRDLDQEIATAMSRESLSTALGDALTEFQEWATSNGLPDEAGTSPHEMDEFLAQESLPEAGINPSDALGHELNEMTEAQSLFPSDQLPDNQLGEESMPDEPLGSLPHEIDEYSTNDELPEGDIDPQQTPGHALEEVEADQSLLPIHEAREVDAQQSLPEEELPDSEELPDADHSYDTTGYDDAQSDWDSNDGVDDIAGTPGYDDAQSDWDGSDGSTGHGAENEVYADMPDGGSSH
jgi:hypothetical protein